MCGAARIETIHPSNESSDVSSDVLSDAPQIGVKPEAKISGRGYKNVVPRVHVSKSACKSTKYLNKYPYPL